jgi:hypothetical protein
VLGSKGQLRRCSELTSLIKTVQIKMAVVIRIISVTMITVCCEHVLGQSLSLGKCPSYPAIKKLDLKKVCTIILVYFIFLIYKIRSFPGFHLCLYMFYFIYVGTAIFLRQTIIHGRLSLNM